MTDHVRIEPGKYVLAVSGGVDSVCLLDILSGQAGVQLIVAHFDHGMRPDSSADAAFVKQLAAHYGWPFELGRAQLGAAASEDQARYERWLFLKAMWQKHQAKAILTAHHADDVVETIIINIMRGTGWRGLCSLRSHGEVLRPLLELTKADILLYARAHHLQWREDSTNQSTQYLRNHVRLKLLPRLRQQNPQLNAQLLELWRRQCQLRDEIEQREAELYPALVDDVGLRRRLFTMLPPSLADEFLRLFLARHSLSQTTAQRVRALQFITSAQNGKKFSLNANSFLKLSREHAQVVKSKKTN